MPFRFSPPATWKRDLEFKRAQGAWVDSISKATITVQTHLSDGDFHIDSKGVKEAVALLTRVRRFATRFLGIRNWEVTDYRLESTTSGQLLKFSAQYEGPGGHRVRLHEWQYFIGKKYFQITYAEDGRTRRSRHEVKSLLSNFSPEGWSARNSISEAVTWVWTAHSLVRSAEAESQGAPCASCTSSVPLEPKSVGKLDKKLVEAANQTESKILKPEEIPPAGQSPNKNVGCIPDKNSGSLSTNTIALCMEEIVKGMTSAVWEDLAGIYELGKMAAKGIYHGVKAPIRFVKAWYRTGSAGEAFQEWKNNQTKLISKLKENLKKLWPTLQALAAQGVEDWGCMSKEEKTLFLCKAGSYAITTGALMTVSGGTLGLTLASAKAGKLGTVGVKIAESIEKAKKTLRIGKIPKNVEKTEDLAEVDSKTANALAKEKWVQGVHVAQDGQVYQTREGEIIRVNDPKTAEAAKKRWKQGGAEPTPPLARKTAEKTKDEADLLSEKQTAMWQKSGLFGEGLQPKIVAERVMVKHGISNLDTIAAKELEAAIVRADSWSALKKEISQWAVRHKIPYRPVFFDELKVEIDALKSAGKAPKELSEDFIQEANNFVEANNYNALTKNKVIPIADPHDLTHLTILTDQRYVKGHDLYSEVDIELFELGKLIDSKKVATSPLAKVLDPDDLSKVTKFSEKMRIWQIRGPGRLLSLENFSYLKKGEGKTRLVSHGNAHLNAIYSLLRDRRDRFLEFFFASESTLLVGENLESIFPKKFLMEPANSKVVERMVSTGREVGVNLSGRGGLVPGMWEKLESKLNWTISTFKMKNPFSTSEVDRIMDGLVEVIEADPGLSRAFSYEARMEVLEAHNALTVRYLEWVKEQIASVKSAPQTQ